MKNILFLLFLVLINYACSSTNLKPITDNRVVFEDDEIRLWRRSKEEQEILNKSGLIYENIKAENYLNSIANRLYPKDVYNRIPFTIKILKDPNLNAFAYPNGVIYVHTGIIANADNEAQIATLLAHEMTHCTHRHALKEFRSIKNKTAALSTVQVSLGGLGGGLGDLISILGTLGTLVSVTGYSKSLEEEADKVGFRVMVDAGYDPKEAPKLFLHLKDEIEKDDIQEPYFFGSHPKLQQRIDNFRLLIKSERIHQNSTDCNQEVFIMNIQELILDNAALNLRAGRYEACRLGVEKYLKINARNPKAYFLLGEVYNTEGNKGDIEKAINYYKTSLGINSSYAEPNRELGLIYYKMGKRELAKRYLASYLKLSPEATDQEYIRYYINLMN